MSSRVFDVIDPERWEVFIKNANLYYNGKTPEIPDFEYDAIWHDIKMVNPNFDVFKYVTFEREHEKGEHSIQFPNFEKVDFDRLQIEMSDYSVLSPKWDGCSICAYYDNKGKLRHILTRSNEKQGVIQTQKLRSKVPEQVDPSIEAILFEALSCENRAKANGLIGSKYKQDEVDREITLMPFDCILRGRKLGYKARMDLTGLDYVTLTIQQALALKQDPDNPRLPVNYKGEVKYFPVDGIVMYDILEPDFGRIYKFYSTENKKSIVRWLHFDTSKETGMVNIVTEFDPVKIGSITVKRCGNAGSWDTIKKKKLGVGSEVEVFLTKVTIPQIANNTPWTEEPHPTCSWCGHDLTEFQGRLVCMNPDCTFWEDYFETRYFNILREKMGSEWVDEFTVNGKFDINMLIRAEKETGFKFSGFLTVPEYLLYVIKPPRISGATYEQVKQRILIRCKTVRPSNTFELAELLIDSINAPNQREYSRMVWEKLVYFLKKVTRLRKQNTVE